MTRVEGERVRAVHELQLLRAVCRGVELALQDVHTPVGFEAAQAVTQAATKLALTLARLDAYARVEGERR
jgi:hypothetical protein